MDASGYFAIAIFILACGRSSDQMVQDTSPPGLQTSETTAIANDTTTIATPSTTPVPVGCTTGTGVTGVCVRRQYCDYGTPAVDYTLYAKRGYVKICTEQEVCCPFEAIVRVEESSSTMKPDDSFDFDEDD